MKNVAAKKTTKNTIPPSTKEDAAPASETRAIKGMSPERLRETKDALDAIHAKLLWESGFLAKSLAENFDHSTSYEAASAMNYFVAIMAAVCELQIEIIKVGCYL